MRAKSIKHAENTEGKLSYPKSYSQRLQILEAELERLEMKTGMGYEVKLEWSPGIVRHKNGKKLLEEVLGNTILICVEDLDEALSLLTHGFVEWLLNQNSKCYRLLINKLIEVFEEMQYNTKEGIVEAVSRLISDS